MAVVMFLACALKSYASDYQYKVLDPRYNPQAQQLIDGTLPTAEDLAQMNTEKHFDFGAFLAIFALVVFPIVIISTAFKTFQLFSNEISGIHKQTLGNIKIEKNEKKEEVESNEKNTTKTISAFAVTDAINEDKAMEDTIIKTVDTEPDEHIVKQKTVETEEPQEQKAEENQSLVSNPTKTLNKFFSSPIANIPDPLLLNTSVLSSNKGICLVEYNKKYSLIGYINNEIFLLNQFDDVKSWEIRSRLSETKNSKDRYIVKLGDYKALVEVSDKNMNLLIEL